MKKYRKLPIVIEAIQFTGTKENIKELVDWLGNCSFAFSWENKKYLSVSFKTLEGDMTAQLLDWIIKGVEGEFYPCKPNIFAKTYEEEI